MRAGFKGWAFASRATRWPAATEVAGYVRNLTDGRVELVAEGETQELENFLKAIEIEMGTYIRNTEVETDSTGSEPLVGFTIHH